MLQARAMMAISVLVFNSSRPLTGFDFALHGLSAKESSALLEMLGKEEATDEATMGRPWRTCFVCHEIEQL